MRLPNAERVPLCRILFCFVGWSLVFAVSISFLYSFGSNYERMPKEETNKGANAILYNTYIYEAKPGAINDLIVRTMFKLTKYCLFAFWIPNGKLKYRYT